MEKRGKREIFLIVIISAVAILPLFFLRDFTPKNELKYIEIAKTMANNGQYFTLYDNGVAYTDKPPFFFWIINFVKFIFGSYNLGVIGTFVSFIPAVLTLIMASMFSKKYFGEKYNLIAPLILLTTPLFFIAASCIRMDILMCFFITGALIIFFLMYDNKMEVCRKNSYMIYIFMGFGIYVKGAAGILVPFITILLFLILEKNIVFLKKIYIIEGLLILLTMILLWFLPAIYFNGIGYINELIVKQTVGRSLNAFIHKRPFYYYLILLPVLFFQYIILLIGMGIHYLKNKIELKKYEKFMLVWFVSTILFFSIVSSKLWLYILPVVFPGAILISGYIKEIIEKDKKVLEKSTYLLNSIVLIIGLILLFEYKRETNGILLKDFLFTAFSYTILSIILLFLYNKNKIATVVTAFVLPFMILILNLIFIVPKYNGLIGLKEISQSIERYNQKDIIVSYDFSDGIYAEYYLDKDIYSTSKKEDVDKLLKEKVILITRTKKISKLDIIWKYKLIYKNSQYCAVEIIGKK